MKRLILSVLVVLAIATAVVGCKSSSTPSSGNTELQGTWMWTYTSSNQTATLTYIFNGNNWTMTITTPTESVQDSGTFTIDPTANPKTIDMYLAACTGPWESNIGKTLPCIYLLSGTNLTIAFGDPGGIARPISFTNGRVFIKQ